MLLNAGWEPVRVALSPQLLNDRVLDDRFITILLNIESTKVKHDDYVEFTKVIMRKSLIQVAVISNKVLFAT